MARAKAIRIENMREFRKSVSPDTRKVIQEGTKRGAEVAAAEARRIQPRGTRPLGKRAVPKRLADSYVATTRGNAGIVRSPLAHARIEEFRRGGPGAVNEALDRKQDEIVGALARGLDDAVRIAGWK